MENTRKPWNDFKQGQLPIREKDAEEEKYQTMSLRDPFWNFMYDQIEKSTYDFTPFFYARTTVFRIMDDVGCRNHFDDGSMTPEEVTLAFTENLDVEFDRVNGIYNVSYTFKQPETARAIVDRYAELFEGFVDEISKTGNTRPLEAVEKNIERLREEINSIETREADLKSKSGIVAPAEYFITLTDHLYSVEMRIVQAESLSKAASELLADSKKRIEKMTSYGTGKSGQFESPISEVLSDPLLYVILTRIFWDSLNLAQAEMVYQDDTPNLKYWQERLETSKRLLSRRTSEDETGRASELMSTLAEESGKAAYLLEHKAQIQSLMDKLPELEKEFVYLHRQRLALNATLKNLEDLKEVGTNYLEKGDKIASVIDPAFLPNRKSEPQFLKLLVSVLFASTICGFGWFFIRENIEVHAGLNK
jgi:uncharacterized protein involved in exopolysaccharide biosynthesis